MSDQPKPQPGIEEIKLYTPGEAGAPAQALRKLSSNENLYGPSPKVVEAINGAVADIWRYPNVDHKSLREAIGAAHGLDPKRIICGVGSDEILYLLAQAYAGTDDQVIMTEFGFEVYAIASHAVGAELVVAAETDRRVDVDKILAAVSPHTKLVYIANPANPTSTILTNEALERLARSLPPTVLLVIDSAYAEFAHAYDGGARLAGELPNVFMTRTFSKLYGLGGLRVGWGYGSQTIIDNLNRIRGPFNLSNLALAGAQAAIDDQDYAMICRENIIRDREYLRNALLQFGLGVDESATNFLLVRFETNDQAQAVRKYLMDCGFLVRSVAHYGFDSAIRITIGTHEDNLEIARLIGEFMGAMRAKL